MIETWEATRFEKPLSTGRTRPLVIECSRATDEPPGEQRRLMVVKCFDLPEVIESGLFSEVIGNMIARDLGVDTPIPCLVSMDRDFCEITNSVLTSSGLHLREGIGVGSEYILGGLTSPISHTPLAPEELAQAASIYGFDLLVQNPDRLPRNPNCGRLGSRLIAFDFNLAFSFLLLIGPSNSAWEVSKLDIGPNHLFFNSLRRQGLNWEPFMGRLQNLSRERVEGLCSCLPVTWQQWTSRVCDHLEEVQANLQNFRFELQRSLA